MRLDQAFELFNEGKFFDAHEALEDLWREAPKHTSARRHLQGLTQLAVAFHHHSTGNFVGALSVLQRGMRNLQGANESLPALDTAQLEKQFAEWQLFLDARVRAGADKNTSGRSDKVPSNLASPAAPRITLLDGR